MGSKKKEQAPPPPFPDGVVYRGGGGRMLEGTGKQMALCRLIRITLSLGSLISLIYEKSTIAFTYFNYVDCHVKELCILN